MKKSEISTIMSHYGEILELSTRFDKEDAKIEIKRLMKLLGLDNEMKIVENNHFIKVNKLSYMQEQGYSTLLDIIMKYNGGKIVEYECIEVIIDEMWFELTDEHKKNVEACLRMIEGQI